MTFVSPDSAMALQKRPQLLMLPMVQPPPWKYIRTGRGFDAGVSGSYMRIVGVSMRVETLGEIVGAELRELRTCSKSSQFPLHARRIAAVCRS